MNELFTILVEYGLEGMLKYLKDGGKTKILEEKLN